MLEQVKQSCAMNNGGTDEEGDSQILNYKHRIVELGTFEGQCVEFT
jgi:hypothetical protein